MLCVIIWGGSIKTQHESFKRYTYQATMDRNASLEADTDRRTRKAKRPRKLLSKLDDIADDKRLNAELDKMELENLCRQD